jgi:hypothetical protein
VNVSTALCYDPDNDKPSAQAVEGSGDLHVQFATTLFVVVGFAKPTSDFCDLAKHGQLVLKVPTKAVATIGFDAVIHPDGSVDTSHTGTCAVPPFFAGYDPDAPVIGHALPQSEAHAASLTPPIGSSGRAD